MMVPNKKETIISETTNKRIVVDDTKISGDAEYEIIVEKYKYYIIENKTTTAVYLIYI